ncbi:hypothetical protein F5X96DRAFT_635117 [Biscogniauxia mediterranea]|nr:hypothetical protein F5X96DRAFT_635117 [Biscogniauxia mediterranea]
MTDVYRRTGRGGAGNFYSQKDVDEVNKTENEDLEAQKQSSTSPSDPQPQPRPHPHPLRSSPILYTQRPDIPARSSSGRGGAGNFTTSPSTSTPTPMNPTITTTTASSSPTTAMMATGGTLSGRGGAGNWASSSQQPYDVEQERRRQEALRGEEGEGGLGLAREVRESLLPRLPPKIHYLHGPGRGRKPDVTA